MLLKPPVGFDAVCLCRLTFLSGTLLHDAPGFLFLLHQNGTAITWTFSPDSIASWIAWTLRSDLAKVS